MKKDEINTRYSLEKLRRFRKPKALFVALMLPFIFGLSLQARAGIFDTIGDIVDTIVDKVVDLFSSAKNLAEDVVGKVDEEVGSGLSGICAVVTASQESGETSTLKALDNCGGEVVNDLESTFTSAGGEIAEQYKNAVNGLEDISKEVWAENTENFVALAKTLNSYYNVTFDNLKDATDDLLDALGDLKNTLADVDFAYGNMVPSTNLDLSYSIPLGSLTLELMIRGATSAVVTDNDDSNYISLDGKVLARLKYYTPTPLYQPGVVASVTYTNPIIRFKKDQITGLLVNQPEGSIVLSVAALPLNFALGLDQLAGIPAVKKLPIIGVAAKAVVIGVDIGTASFDVPITGQTGNDLDVAVSISGGIELKISITDRWAVKVSERLGWVKEMTLDIPSWELNTDAIPNAVLAQLEDEEDTSEPSYSERIMWLTFDDANTSSVIDDKSNYGNDAIKVGGVTLTDGAATFNGTDGYIDLPDNILDDIDEITILAEVKIHKDQKAPFWIYGLGNTKDDLGDGYLFTTGNNYRSSLGLCNWACEQTVSSDAEVNLPRGSWQTIAYTLKGNVATLYLNGDVVSTKTDMTLKPSDIGNGQTLTNYLGRSLYGGDNYFDGAIRDFQIWKGALTHKEIIENTTPASSDSERIVWLTFDDASNATVIDDHSTYGNDAYPFGGVSLGSSAATFDGTDDYIKLKDSLLDGVDEITIYAEVNISESQEAPYWIYGLGNIKDDAGDGYLFTTGDAYRSSLGLCDWTCEQTVANANNLPRNSWQSIAYTLKGNVATLYLNGKVINTKTDMTLKPSQIGDGMTLANYLGRSLYSGDHYFKGAIRDFQIWNGALTRNEVVALSQ